MAAHSGFILRMNKSFCVLPRVTARAHPVNSLDGSDFKGWAMAGTASPRWRHWESDKGHLYATAHGLSAHMPGASVTVDAKTVAGLQEAIAEAEHEAGRARSAWGRRGYG